MALKETKPRHYMFTYKGEPLQVVQSFKYLGGNGPWTNRWNSYYMFKNQCNQRDTEINVIQCFGGPSIVYGV